MIFNPSVALQIRGRAGGDTAFIPLNLFYRFTGCLSAVYESLSDSKLYHSDGNALYVDKKRATECARKLPLFRNMLTIIPDVYVDRTNTFSKGIVFLTDGRPLGIANHQDVLSMVELLDHLDVTGYTLMAGIVDELEAANDNLKAMSEMLQKIYTIVQNSDTKLPIMTAAQEPISSPTDSFTWGSVTDWRPMS